MKPRQKRIAIIGVGLVAIAAASTLVLNAFNDNLLFFFSPTQILAKEAPPDRPFRVGGLVEAGSVKRQSDGVTVSFQVTDTAKTVPVTYRGILPDLFQEGKGVVARGRLGPDGIFRADQVLARHDENYMPPEAAYAIEKAQKAQGTLVMPATAVGNTPATDIARGYAK